MYATNLATIARGAGLKVVEVQGWKTRGHAPLEGVKTIVCHHTAGPGARRDASIFPSLKIVTDGRPGLTGPLCNLGLGRDGTVFTVAAGLAYHAGAVRDDSFSNAWSLGIEAENAGDGIDPWPSVQLSAYHRLCAALVDAYSLTVARVLAHREVCFPAGRKPDPVGIGMPGFRDAVGRDLVDLRASRDAPREAPRPYVLKRVLGHGDEDPMGPGRKRVAGPVTALQRRLITLGYHLPRYGADGDFGDETETAVRALQRAAGFARKDVDGVVGRKTCKPLGWDYAG